MKSFLLQEVLLVSLTERRARKEVLDPEVNLITGDNETGKSSLIKSIFRAFGAEPARLNETWKAADVRILVKFQLNGADYAIFRYRDLFALFDAKRTLLGTFTSVTNQLGPRLSELFDFGLRLPDRKGDFVVLPPSYYFLPFYMDQDSSWVRPWSSFSNLSQFANWKTGVIQYHAGIRGNRYYEAQAALMKADAEAGRSARKREALHDTYTSLNGRYQEGMFNVDFDAYQTEIQQLLTSCERLRSLEEKFKQDLVEQRNRRQAVATQLEITQQVQQESRNDYQQSLDQAGHLIECPTCGAGYENSFADRFSIAVDEDRCSELALQLSAELRQAEADIAATLKETSQIEAQLTHLQSLLAKKEGEVELSDLIRQQGRKELRDLMVDDLEAIKAEEDSFALAAIRWQRAMKEDDSKERRAEVNRFYAEHLFGYLVELDAASAAGPGLKAVVGSLNSTGSELPRALLAYQIAFLTVMRKYSTAAFAPIVIDSPNQQDQDPVHHRSILKFIRDHRPQGAQLVLGVVNTADVSFTGKQINLTVKNRLLSGDQFSMVQEEMQPYLEAAMRGES